MVLLFLGSCISQAGVADRFKAGSAAHVHPSLQAVSRPNGDWCAWYDDWVLLGHAGSTLSSVTRSPKPAGSRDPDLSRLDFPSKVGLPSGHILKTTGGASSCVCVSWIHDSRRDVWDVSSVRLSTTGWIKPSLEATHLSFLESEPRFKD